MAFGGRTVAVSRAIRAETIWSEGAFRNDRALLVEDDRVAGVVHASEIPSDAEAEDWGRVALLPGTVNAHGHAFQSLFKGWADDRRFESWRDDVLYPFSERLTLKDVYAGALLAFSEALLAGVTTTVDFHYLHDSGNENAEVIIRAARDVGIRLVLARAFYDPDAETAAPERYREPPEDAAARCIELAEKHDSDPLVAVQPAPHSLHAASPETIAAALEVAEKLNCPCHLHLAEARYEVDLIQKRFGTTPVRLLADRGLLGPRLVTVHTVWADDDELDLIAQARAAVVHCPGANAFLGDGIARLPEMLERGIRVALGPDGGCANNRQSVFDEMRTAGLFAKARRTDGSALDAVKALELGTSSGGDVLGLPVGSFDVDGFADAVALDLDDLSLQPPGNLERHIVNSMQPSAIAKVMVGGRVVVQGGVLTTVDHAAIRDLVAESTKGWVRS